MTIEEIDLGALTDESLVEQIHADLYDGLKEEIEEGVHILLKRGWTPYDTDMSWQWRDRHSAGPGRRREAWGRAIGRRRVWP